MLLADVHEIDEVQQQEQTMSVKKASSKRNMQDSYLSLHQAHGRRIDALEQKVSSLTVAIVLLRSAAALTARVKAAKARRV